MQRKSLTSWSQFTVMKVRGTKTYKGTGFSLNCTLQTLALAVSVLLSLIWAFRILWYDSPLHITQWRLTMIHCHLPTLTSTADHTVILKSVRFVHSSGSIAIKPPCNMIKNKLQFQVKGLWLRSPLEKIHNQLFSLFKLYYYLSSAVANSKTWDKTDKIKIPFHQAFDYQ